MVDAIASIIGLLDLGGRVPEFALGLDAHGSREGRIDRSAGI
jgi:hypothetical protein